MEFDSRCSFEHGTFLLHWKVDKFDIYILFGRCGFRIVYHNVHNAHSPSNGQSGGISVGNIFVSVAPTQILSLVCFHCRRPYAISFCLYSDDALHNLCEFSWNTDNTVYPTFFQERVTIIQSKQLNCKLFGYSFPLCVVMYYVHMCVCFGVSSTGCSVSASC